MRRWLQGVGLDIVLMSVGLLAGSMAWGQNSMCAPDLKVSLSPAVSRPGETVPVQVNIDRSCPERCFSTFNFSFLYSEGVRIDENAINIIDSEDGVYKPNDYYDGATDDPSSHRLSYFIVGLTNRATGPVLTVPVQVESIPPQSQATFILNKAQVQRMHEFCLIDPDDAIGTLQVTGTGTGRGDVDGDGSVDTTDVQWALRLLLNTVTASPGVLKSADAWPEAGDGQITLSDALSVLRLAVGLE